MSDLKRFQLTNAGGDQISAVETLGDSTADLLRTSANKSKQDQLQESSLFPSVQIETARVDNSYIDANTSAQLNADVSPHLLEPNTRNRIGQTSVQTQINSSEHLDPLFVKMNDQK